MGATLRRVIAIPARHAIDVVADPPKFASAVEASVGLCHFEPSSIPGASTAKSVLWFANVQLGLSEMFPGSFTFEGRVSILYFAGTGTSCATTGTTGTS